VSYGPPPSDPYGQPPAPGTPPPSKGFFGALFDFSFEHFVTPMIVKVVYLLGILLYLCLIRMTLEFYLAVTRMSQDIHQRLR
jgi:hypothetical protein